jgi:hypothetical protein
VRVPHICTIALLNHLYGVQPYFELVPRIMSPCAESLAVLETAACSTTCAATGSRCKEDSGKFQPCCRGDAICVSVGEFAECMPNKQPLAAEVEKGAKQVQCRTCPSHSHSSLDLLACVIQHGSSQLQCMFLHQLSPSMTEH